MVKYFRISSILGGWYSRLYIYTVLLLSFGARVSADGPVKLKNPLKVGSIQELLSAILGVVIVIATPIVVFFIIYAGFFYVTARGNTQQVQQATTALTYAIIGGLLILGSFALAEVLKGVVDSFRA